MLLGKRSIFLALIWLFLSALILEAGELSYRLDQSKIRLIIGPGDSKAGQIKVYSQSGEPIDLKVYMEDWSYTNAQDGSKEFYPAGSTTLSCAPWFKFSPTEFTLPAYGVTTVNYVVNVPTEAQGGHYAVMFFETAVQKSAADSLSLEGEVQSGVGLAIRLGSLIYVEVKDTVKREAALRNFSVFKGEKDKYLFVTVDLKNISKVDITAGGSFHLMDKEGMVSARGEFNDVYTFPGDEGKLKAVWKNTIPAGDYDLVITLDLGKAQEEAGLGRGPVIVKEAEVKIGSSGEVIKVGGLE